MIYFRHSIENPYIVIRSSRNSSSVSVGIITVFCINYYYYCYYFEASASQRQAQYFVYCRTCKDITPGKLRVCCSSCNEGAMVLYQVINYGEKWPELLLQRTCFCTDAEETQVTDQFTHKHPNPVLGLD